jgi:hypothetical protein
MTDPDLTDPVLELHIALERNQAEARHLRQQLLRIVESGTPQREVARRLSMPYGSLSHWVRQARRERDAHTTE